ncbi:microfibril-associated glycoprotein 4-like [Branchiostoma floridae x Branchiostoma japonicum]
MWLYHLSVLTVVLQWSVVAGEGRTDQLTMSLCRIWEECSMAKTESLLPPDEENQENKSERQGLVPQPDLQPYLALFGRTNYFSDCSEIHTAMTLSSCDVVTSGVHDIKPVGLSGPISVYCDQTTAGGGWTVIQRRFDGSVDFNRPFENAFRYGFGSANGEHWLGLENMHYLTSQNAYELYIELEDWIGTVKYARYSTFAVESDPYNLNVGGFSGTAGDGFYLSYNQTDDGYLNGQPFSAREVDRDSHDDISCAGQHVGLTGGWWYKACSWSALNGPYLRPSDFGTGKAYTGFGIYWNPFGGEYRNYLKKSKMMVRPSDFQP